jgi:GDP-D-mannose dehydratase
MANNHRVALLTGITGQDGSYLAEHLIENGYEVHGVVRRTSTISTERIDHIFLPEERGRIHYGDLVGGLDSLIYKIKPDLIFNLAAMSHVAVSFHEPVSTWEINAVGVIRLLETIRQACQVLGKEIRFYQASCHDVETVAITPTGAKSFKDIKAGDFVYTINEATNELEIKPVKRVVVSTYSGDMIRVSGRRLNMLVTPNHSVFLRGDAAGNFYVAAEELLDSANVASELREESFYERTSTVSLCSGSWVGKHYEKVVFSDFIEESDIPYNAYKNRLTELSAADFFYLCGLYIGDGYTAPKRKAFRKCSAREFVGAERSTNGRFLTRPSTQQPVTYKSSNIYFAVPEGDKSRSRLISTLDRIGIDYKTSQEWVRFSSYPLMLMFKQCGDGVYEKKIPQWILESSTENLLCLFAGIIGSDGHIKANGISHAQITTSPELAHNMVELCIRLGLQFSQQENQPARVWFEKDRRWVNGGRSWSTRISKDSCRSLRVYPHHVSRDKYSGPVWCLEVEDNHNFLVRRGNSFFFSGNSSEMFGRTPPPQSETSYFHPASPYGVAKLAAYWGVRSYRDSYGMFAANGILFNHESKRRGKTFVTRKITRIAARIVLGLEHKIELGNLDALRDWGHSADYVRAMLLILEHWQADDWVVSTGEAHTVRKFAELVFAHFGLDFYKHLVTNDDLKRPNEVPALLGDSTKIRGQLGWQPKYTFEQLVEEMCDSDFLQEKALMKQAV